MNALDLKAATDVAHGVEYERWREYELLCECHAADEETTREAFDAWLWARECRQRLEVAARKAEAS